jgi:NADPH:quinone reductase-like Zn-dependent oxidoreductase
MMKAVIYEKYGDASVLQLKEVAKPSPKSDEILIKVHASSVSAGDWRLRKADPFLARLFNGLFRPRKVKILGFELAGVVESVGAEVKAFQPGDAVFAFCGLKFGGYAEYACLSEKDLIAHKPANMSFLEAATTPLGALSACLFLQKGGIQSGQKILIYGASGSVGTFAIQLARHFGARVTAVCSTPNLELVKSLGADDTLDYTQSDLNTLPEPFDLVFDAVGKIKKADCKGILKPGAAFVSVRGQVKPKQQDLLVIKSLVEAGKLKSVIDRTYELAEIQEAHRYVEQFRKKGNVAVRVAQ